MTVIDVLMTIGFVLMVYGLAYFVYDCIEQHNKKDCEVFDAQKVRPICGYMEYSRGGNSMNKQIVYKVNGDFNGNIKGDNVTVILMGDGNFNGNINSKDGEVVVIKGDINGDVKANKVLCPTKPTTEDKNCQSYKSIRHNEDSLTSPYERIDFTYDGDKCVNKYKSLALANVTCPHCRKSFLKNLKVVTTVVDGEVSNTEIQNYGGYIL